MKTYKVLALLLTYPDQEWLAVLGEMAKVLDNDALLPKQERRGLAQFIKELGSSDIYDLQERYVDLFDRSRSLSLHLFEHVHGESRDRGQAMVDLRKQYEDHGLRLTGNELPDFLPLFLEYLSQLPNADAKTQLKETAHILDAIGQQLVRRGSRYHTVIGALLTLAGERMTIQDVVGKEPDDDNDLDAQWAESPVTFGPGCSSQRPQQETAVIHFARNPKESASWNS